jgi:hypothetical protein
MDPGRACAFLDAPQQPHAGDYGRHELSSRTVSYRVEPDIKPDMERARLPFRLELESPITLQACRANSSPGGRASGAGWHLKKVA